jgi:hypothetical protein
MLERQMRGKRSVVAKRSPPAAEFALGAGGTVAA